MGTYLNCEVKAGYHDVFAQPIAEHTYVIAEKDGVQYALPCFGDFAIPGHERGKTGITYPADLYSADIWRLPKGNSLDANLYVALGMGQFTLSPRYDYRVQDWEDWWRDNPALDGFSPGCHAGIVYGVTGVCHQACNRVLWSSQQDSFWTTPVAWPPSFSLSIFVYGAYGGAIEAATALAYSLVALAQQAPEEAGAKNLSQAGLDAMGDTYRLIREALTAGAPDEARRQEVQKLVAAAGGINAPAPRNLDGVFAADAKFSQLKTELDTQLLRAEVSHDEYANSVNRAFGQMLAELQNALPPETFKALFGGVDTSGPVALIVREQMPESYEDAQEAIRI
jgi:hypothetical protein